MWVRDAAGAAALMVIETPGDGTVRASLGRTAMTLDPREVSRLVDLYRLAQSVALQDRGRW
jgi:hypothetical protein